MISGTKGSGTIFFSNCNLRCTYCQNYQISQEGLGNEVTDEQLADEIISLQKKGCHNINLVSPIHFMPNFVSALIIAIEKGLNIPIVFNSNGYEKPEILQLLEGIIDIYLPDIKYSSNDTAVKLSNAPRYVEYNKAAIKEMHRQVGPLKVDGDGIAISGIILRHLILPNDLAGSQKSFKFLANEVSKDVHVSIMAQYHPCYKAMEDANLNRRITYDEYHRALRWAQEAGLHNILTQEMESSEIFLPDFKREDPFK
jgi:putative pyruvate formate lyase activating enzyme